MTRIESGISNDLSFGCLHSTHLHGDNNTLFCKAFEYASLENLCNASCQHEPPELAYKYYSSRLDVYHQSIGQSWELHWDEKFFQYLQYSLIDTFFLEEFEVSCRRWLFKLFCIAAEIRSCSDPAFAIRCIVFAQKYIRNPTKEKSVQPSTFGQIERIYLIIRAITYLHEQAHCQMGIDNGLRRKADKQLDDICKRIRDQGDRFLVFGGTSSSNKLKEYFQKVETDDVIRLETSVDYCALQNVIDYCVNLGGEDFLTSEEILSLIYPAVMMWHYFSETLSVIRRHVCRQHAIDWKQYIQSLHEPELFGHLRNNARGFMLMDMVFKRLEVEGVNIQRHLLSLAKNKRLQRRYFSTQTKTLRSLLFVDWAGVVSLTFEPPLSEEELSKALRGELLYSQR